MYRFSNVSKKRLMTCHPKIILLFSYALATSCVDFTIASGYRGKDEQEKYVRLGTSPLHYPNSKHNKSPSLAIDVYPYKNKRMCNGDQPIDKYWIKYLSEHIKKCAIHLGIDIDWGGDWNKPDLPHWELKG